MAGLFGALDVDVASAKDLITSIPIETTEIEVKNVRLEKGTKNPNDNYLVITWKAPHWPYGTDRWHFVPVGDPDSWDDTIKDAKGETEKTRNERARSYLKKELVEILGVPESRVNTVNPQELIGIKAIGTTKQNGDYVNLDRTRPLGTSGATLPKPTAAKSDDTNPFLTA